MAKGGVATIFAFNPEGAEKKEGVGRRD